MKYNMLEVIIRRFKGSLKDIDFNKLPDCDDENYREFALKAADMLFSEGRYTQYTEMTLELFDIDETNDDLKNLTKINALTDLQRHQLRFCLDLRDICYPLFKAQKVDWTAWPWNMKDGRTTMYNSELCDFITEGGYPYLGAAICYDYQQYAWNKNEGDFFTSVALNEMSENYFYDLEGAWRRDKDKQKLEAELVKFTDDLRGMENHMLLGKRLCLDHLAQEVYDAVDQFICDVYVYNQVDFSLELSAWLHENWTIGEAHPAKEKFKALEEKMRELMEKHHVKIHPSDFSHVWNIIVLDALGVSMFSEEEENRLDDDDDWQIDDDED